MTLSEAIAEIEEMRRDALKMKSSANDEIRRANTVTEVVLDDVLDILGQVRPGSGMDHALNSGDGSYRP
jgi:hypothetical protein